MSYSIIPVERFRKEAKRLLGKYPSLKADLARLNEQLLQDPLSGTPLGNNTYKIRLDIRSKGKGKSGGARIITYVVTKNERVYLLTIYDKSEFESIDTSTIKKIIQSINS